MPRKPRCIQGDDSVFYCGSKAATERAIALLRALGIGAEEAGYRSFFVDPDDEDAAEIVLREYYEYQSRVRKPPWAGSQT